MNHLAFDPAFVQRVAGALLHFIWQGAAIAAITAICLRMMSRTSAETRYLVSISGLAGMLAAAVLTFFLYDRIGHVTLKALVWVRDGNTAGAVTASPTLMYWIVGLWSAGVFGCIGRLVLAWHFSCRLLRLATEQAPVEVTSLFEHTAAVIGVDVVRKKIRLLISGAMDSPAVVGWIRPAILVPVSALTGLTNEQLMAVLAHELAHIRRHDFLVNTLQTCVESLLFYHPAVWWLSGRVRAERENCCDDLAVRVSGNRRVYVQALVDLERARPTVNALVVSAAGGSLKERVQRLLGFETSTVDWRSVLATFAFVCVWIVTGLWPSALPGAIPPAPQVRQQEQTQLASALPILTPGGAATVMSTVAAIATAQPVVPEAQLPGQPGVVTGILRSSTGIPLVGVRIALMPADRPMAVTALQRLERTIVPNASDPSSGVMMGLTDSMGRYVVNVRPGRYYILVGVNGPRFYYPGVADLGLTTAVEVTARATIEVPDTVVSGGAVTGRLLDVNTGERLRIKNLILCCDYFKPFQGNRGGGGGGGSFRSGIPFMATLSADGSFVFPFVPSGNYYLVGTDRGPGSGDVVRATWALAVGTSGTTGLRLEVPDGALVEGTVLDQAGRPVSAEIRLRPNPANSNFNTIGPLMDTGGSFFASTDTAGNSYIASIFIPKVDPSLEGIQDRLLERVKTRVRTATAGPDGRFEFPGVYPGTYVLEVKSGLVSLPEREIQVGIAGLPNVSFQVSAILVTGRIIAPTGTPLPKLNYIRLVRSGSNTDILYGFPDKEGHFSLALLPGQYRVFTERLGPSVQSVSDGSRDITNTELIVEDGRNPQIVVTLAP